MKSLPFLLLFGALLLLVACQQQDNAGPRIPIPIPPHGISDVVAEGRQPKQNNAPAPQTTMGTPYSAPTSASPSDAELFAIAGIQWKTPKGWRLQRSPSPMRLATYFLPNHAAGTATCALFYFGRGQGGSIQANLDRWVGQFAKDPATQRTKKIEKSLYNGLSVHIVEISGPYSDGMGPMASASPRPNQRMLGAIVEAPEGPVFFKCVGPDASIQQARGGFSVLLQSVQRK